MKKLITAMLCLSLLFAFSGCEVDSGVQKETQSNTGSAQNSAADSKTTFGLNETAVFKTLKITATAVEKREGTDFFKPETGKIFVGVKFTIENISDKDQTISSMLLFDPYVDGVKTSLDISSAVVFEEGTLDGSLSAGKKMEGYYALQVSQSAAEIQLEVKADILSSSKATFKLSLK